MLLALFQTSRRRFNVEIQPQLVLLQKTLLNVEGLGRQLDPELDLWTTAKPFLERWMLEQIGWRGPVERLKARRRATPSCCRTAAPGAPGPATPTAPDRRCLLAILEEQRRTNRLLLALIYGAGRRFLLLAAGAALAMLAPVLKRAAGEAEREIIFCPKTSPPSSPCC